MCEVQLKGFTSISSDNDENYIQQLIAIIESVDELASISISKSVYDIKVRIAPSVPKYINSIIHEMTKFNNLFGIKLSLSKSIKTSSVITFNIETL